MQAIFVVSGGVEGDLEGKVGGREPLEGGVATCKGKRCGLGYGGGSEEPLVAGERGLDEMRFRDNLQDMVTSQGSQG